MSDWIQTITKVLLRVKTPPPDEFRIDRKDASRQLLDQHVKEDLGLHSTETHRQHQKSRLTQALLIIVLLITTNCISIYVTRQNPDTAACTKKLNVWSPLLEAIEYEEVILQNEFDAPSKWRGPPTLSREQAWLDLYTHDTISIPPGKLEEMNKSHPHASQTYNFLNGGYEAHIAVYDQLQCLDYIRQYTWFQGGAYGPDSINKVPIPPSMQISDIGRRMHVDHCIETLRKTLMCHGDVSPMLVRVDPESPTGYVEDFNTHVMCRKFERLGEGVREMGNQGVDEGE